ncbi:hypothetical protein [Vibrio jasicida]|uniref:hypothetical protein n=1 Tax=Vibrio jasicida TaxID=766224 RepID=UPI0005EDF119|nr:hypothetical protein [Vibrio jasicida]
MAISLKKAYAACLWLAERKLGIPVEQQRGEWDLTKNASLDVSRLDLITSLPRNYFDETSCYWGILNDDFEDEFAGLEFIDASNFIDGPIFKYEDQDNFYAFSPFRESRFFLPNGDEILSESECKGEVISTTPLALIEIDDLKINSSEGENKSNQAKLTAHITLTSKLATGQFTAKGYHQDIQDTSHMSETPSPRLIEDIPKSVWVNKVIPNYVESALELGMMRFKDLLAETAIAYRKQDESRMEYLSTCESWYSHITVENEQDFTNWIMAEVRKLFPTPEHATFKPQGNGYLIQFGSDKPTTVRNSKGMSLLYKILKEYRKSSYSIGSGYSAEEISADSQFDIGMNTKKPNSKHGYEEKLRNQFFDLISQYFETDDWDEKEKFASAAVKLLPKINELNGQVVYTKEDLLKIFRNDLDWFMKHSESLKLSSKIDEEGETKGIDSHRKNLENTLDKLKISCPHFAYYLGSLASKKALSLGYSKENEEFYFICDDEIQWDFG